MAMPGFPLPAPAPPVDGNLGIIIQPPPNIRTIVDKMAEFVAKNGLEFERRIIVSNAGNAMFNFLNPTDPYHAYYHHKLAEFLA